MIDTDKLAFAQAMNRLAVALRDKEPDASQMRVYFEALKDLEVEFLVEAADRLAKTAEWFPKTSEWREMAAKVEHQRTEQLRAILRKRIQPLCLECRDTGFAMNPTANRVQRCDCAKLRRLEILGRSPMPSVPELPSPADERERLKALIADVVKGMP